jgi:hypothetical protein
LDGKGTIIYALPEVLSQKCFMNLANVALMIRSIAFGISLPTEMMKKIDIDRGDVPRSRYILRILEKQYTFEGKKGQWFA